MHSYMHKKPWDWFAKLTGGGGGEDIDCYLISLSIRTMNDNVYVKDHILSPHSAAT